MLEEVDVCLLQLTREQGGPTNGRLPTKWAIGFFFNAYFFFPEGRGGSSRNESRGVFQGILVWFDPVKFVYSRFNVMVFGFFFFKVYVYRFTVV